MSPGSNTESYPAFAHIGSRENPGKNLNQVTSPDRESNPGHVVSRPDALTVTPQVWTRQNIANGLIVRHYPILTALTPDNLRVGLTMYKALIRSVITYAAPAWGFAAVSHLRKLQVIQNQVIRLITHLPRVASRRKFHDELELPTIDEFIARLARNLYAEARANPNPLISGLGQYDPRLRRRHQTGPLAILLRQEDREAGVTPRFW
ncbi:hypothetical protein ANN_17194 [Periplaneta americana]|uniref:RNA-directed DNA polymerase from mobile element jockey n=1 Tax=Periplaneta americana TaxID=6978 RepID=A0ABQ8STA4_PERAM|nr:hypothetical protein ANN_17194 [Periplaneta americana]